METYRSPIDMSGGIDRWENEGGSLLARAPAAATPAFLKIIFCGFFAIRFLIRVRRAWSLGRTPRVRSHFIEQLSRVA